MQKNDFERASAAWMKREDERILEYLADEELARPKLISREVFKMVCPKHVKERLQLLEYAGLVTNSGIDSYELTECGTRYLCGDLDAAHQPTPTVDRVLCGRQPDN